MSYQSQNNSEIIFARCKQKSMIKINSFLLSELFDNKPGFNITFWILLVLKTHVQSIDMK